MSIKKSIAPRFANCSFADQSGAILVLVALSLVILLGMIGLAIDLGHAYVNKSQLQNIADASALAGSSALNYTPAGIINAVARATSPLLNNKFEFNQKSLTINPSWVTFSTTLTGPYYTAATVPSAAIATIKFVKVSIPASQSSSIFFGKVIPGIPSSFNLNLGAEAVAGLERETGAVCNGVLDPFAVPPGPNGGLLDGTGNFGYKNGEFYELRFSGSSGKTCSDFYLPGAHPLVMNSSFYFADPDGCGNNTTCLQDSLSDTNSGGDCVPISTAALDTIGDSVGTESAVLTAMQGRFDQDTNSTVYSTIPTYNSGYVNGVTNGRRIVRVSITDGVVPPAGGKYTVVGVRCFFMSVRPDASPLSSSICLMYIGQCGETTNPMGAATLNWSNGFTKWVLFR